MTKFFSAINLQLFLAGTILNGIAAFIPWFNSGGYFTLLRRYDTKDVATVAPLGTTVMCALTMCLIVNLNTSDKMYSPSNPDLGFTQAIKDQSKFLMILPICNYILNRMILRRLIKRHQLEQVVPGVL